MTFSELRQKLDSLAMFSETELAAIVETCGKATLGNAVIACEIIGLQLTGSDVDEITRAADSDLRNELAARETLLSN